MGGLGRIRWVTKLLLAAEYGRWHNETDSQTPLVPSAKVTQERFYVMAAYRLLPWLTPGMYLSALYPNVDVRDGRDAYQHTLSAHLRFDITPQLAVQAGSGMP